MELKIEHLSKQFKDKTAVNDVSLTLTPGVWGLLGANGAGKTTLMRMIADIMTPTNGAVYYDGKDIRELGEVYRSKFGFLPQDFWVSPGFYGQRLFGVYGCAERYSYKGNYQKDQLFVGYSFALRCEKEKNLQSVRRHEASCWYCAGYVERPGDTCHGRTDSRTRSRRARASAEFHFRVFA